MGQCRFVFLGLAFCRGQGRLGGARLGPGSLQFRHQRLALLDGLSQLAAQRLDLPPAAVVSALQAGNDTLTSP